jgi:hypothetical protein
MFRKILLILGFTLLTACTSSTDEPQRIAAYPIEKQIAVHPLSPEKTIIYNANIDLAVSNVDKSVDKVHNLVYEYGGYVTSSQSWLQNNEKLTSVIITVPSIYFEAVHRSILALGDLISEQISGDLQTNSHLTNPPSHMPPYSYITINLHSKVSGFPSITLPDWRPIQTLAKAWNVLAAILDFLLDILIWVGVVAGPFVILGWGFRRLAQKRGTRKNHKTPL